MVPELQAYYEIDPGFAQFVERHGSVASMPDIRKAYRRWEYDIILEKLDEERRAAKIAEQFAELETKIASSEARIASSEARGEAKGKTNTQMEIAMKAFAKIKRGRSVSEITETLKEFDNPDEIIEEAKNNLISV